jgi:hypothetical protein
MNSLPPYSLPHGASWLDTDGSVYPIRGFHEAWLRENPELAGGCANVCEVVLKKGWISVSVFSGGYVELLVPNRRDPEVLSRIGLLLGKNRGSWTKALIMSMDEEGYAMLGPEAVDDGGCFASSLLTRF